MAAPKFTPVDPVDEARGYESPPVAPDPWRADRPGDLEGRQPVGRTLGFQGPDQGYALKLAEVVRAEVVVQDGESVDDALRGAVAIALRRASLFGRAPVIHDLRLALGIWGFLSPEPPADLVAERRARFRGVANAPHHYTELRGLADATPESTLRSAPTHFSSIGLGEWRRLTGVEAAPA